MLDVAGQCTGPSIRVGLIPSFFARWGKFGVIRGPNGFLKI